MGKVVCHMSKASAESSGGLTNHIDRIQSRNASENIDLSRTHLNFELVQKTGTIDEMIKQRLSNGYQGKKAIRKDAVTSQRYILSGSHDAMMKLDRYELLQWAKDSYDYFAKMYGEKNIIRATVHLDERTPHMHLITVPLTVDGRLSAKDFTGTKKKLQELQTNYAKIVEKYGLERGLSGSNRKHITTKDYYQYVNSNELTAKNLIEHPNAVDLCAKLIEEADKGKKLQHIAEVNRILKDKEYGQEISKRAKQAEKSRGEKKSNDKRFGVGM